MDNKLFKITNNNIRNISVFLELFKFRSLILIIFQREFLSTYKQTILGPLWIILNPIITSFVFVVIFSKVGNISTDNIPPFLFYFSALTIWNYFQNNLIQISSFYIASASYFRKLYFPRLIIPFSYLLNNSVRFLIQFFILILFCYLIYDVKLIFNFQTAAIIVFVYLYCSLFCLGLGLILNSFTYKFRDLTYLTTYALSVWMFLSPVVYPISQAPLKLKIILSLNPITPIIELFRYSIFGYGSFSIFSIMVSIIFLLFFLTLGIFMFTKTEKDFIDTV